MIDLHTHILPGIDDGVKTEDEAVEFARVAEADGIRRLVATPHCKDGFYVNGRREVLDAVGRLQGRLRESGVGLEIVPGAEVHLCADLVDRIADGRAPTLADNGKTLLLELSTSQYPVELENLVFRLRLAGVVTVFAHPERIRYFRDDLEHWESVVRLGAFGQVTTGSILGKFGEEIQEVSEEMLRRRLVHVIASDSHNVRGRPPILSEAVALASAWIGEELASRMTVEFPAALLDGREPDVPLPEEPSRKRSFLGRLFRGQG